MKPLITRANDHFGSSRAEENRPQIAEKPKTGLNSSGAAGGFPEITQETQGFQNPIKKPTATDNDPRSRAQKWADVMELLGRPELAACSDRELARRADVSQPFVGKVRRQVTAKTTATRVLAQRLRGVAVPSTAPRRLASSAIGWPSAQWVRYSAPSGVGRALSDFDPFK